MKVFLTFLLIASAAYASEIHEYAPPVLVNEARVTTGVSSQSRAQDNQGNYKFAYREDHHGGGSFRAESRDSHSGQVIGSYGLRDIDGRVRVVNYVADDLHGFRASISTNEPGVVPQASAGTSISSPAGVAVAPAVVEEVHPVATDVHAAEPLVAAHQPVAIDAHGPAPIAAPAYAAHDALPIAAHGPAPIAAPAYAAPYAGPIVHEAPATLIKNYAGSIYGPSLLTDNVIFSKPALAAAPLAGPSVAYEAPLSPNYGIPAALETHDGAGFYEPTLVYSNPSGIGYALGTNVGQFGYQLTYRKKKK